MTSYSYERARDISDQIVAWRRDFHQHPELGFQEIRTARVVAETLRGMGVEAKVGVGKTGVVAEIGEGAPIIAIRADMDALPIVEENEVSYASKTRGVMHACGHDAHTAMLLGVARILTEMPNRPTGTFRLLFQPCEETVDTEGKSGAFRMVEEGAMDAVNRVIALHVSSDLPSGKIVIQEGFISAAADDFDARIIGRGVHAAHPDMGIDPIYLAGQVINAIQGIRARRINPIRPAVVTIGSIHGGDARNVIPEEVTISGTLRSYDDDTRERLSRELETALGVARALGGSYELKLIRGCPSVENDRAVAATIRQAAHDLFGADSIIHDEPSMGGEDFSYMTRRAPGAMFLLGAKKDHLDRPHHNPKFDLSEASFERGTALLAEAACRLMMQSD